MKRLLLISIFALMTIGVKAYYIPYTLYSMILMADKIVYGQIIAIDSTTFTIKIDGSITEDTGFITVQKFENWTCAMRWTNYQLKQSALFFLDTAGGRISVMGAGNEGELPTFKNEIYINRISLLQKLSSNDTKNKANNNDNWEDFDPKSFELYGDRYYGIKLDLTEFIQTIQNIRSCFRLNIDYQTARLICPKEKVDKLLAEDKIFRWTYRELIK
jgi:hypothetical protein